MLPMTTIRHYRQKNGVTLTWLAKELDISRSTLWRYEQGYAKPPKSVLFHIAQTLHIPMDDLYDDENVNTR